MPASVLSFFDSKGQRKVTLKGSSVSIGRATDRDITLDDPLVSRHHAIISPDGESWTVTDEKSMHGTFLNGVRVNQAILNPGDVLQMGSLKANKIQVFDSEEHAAAPSAETSYLNLVTSMQGITGAPSKALAPAHDMELLSWLIGAARQLNDEAGIDDFLGILLQLTLQLTNAERGFVFLWKENKLQFAKGRSCSGESLEPDDTISQNSIDNAINSGQKVTFGDTHSDEMAMGWSSVVLNDIRRIYCIPLRKRPSPKEPKQTLGLLYLDSRIRPGDIAEINHLILDTLAVEAATLLQNALLAEAEQHARKAREELALAARIHSGLMSFVLPSLPYATMRAKSVPCLAIGGDFYDAIVMEDCIIASLVDVSGKGVSAAIVAATLQGVIHTQLAARQGLRDVAAAVNAFLCERNVGKYATMVIAKLYHDGRLEYINCGHVPPVIVWGKQVRQLEETNFVVGLLPEAYYVSANDLLCPGERLLLATDGITETENSDGAEFQDNWLSAVTHSRNIGDILDQVTRFRGPTPAQDDCTLVEISYSGATALSH